ncbi:unnamed protein product, partial [Prorocentrum cordatum]
MSLMAQMTKEEFFAQMNSTINQRLDAKLSPIQDQVGRLEDTVAQHSKQFRELQAKVDKQQTQAPGQSSTPGTSSGGGASGQFHAEHVLLKNFASWETRKQTGIDRAAVEQLLTHLNTVVPSSTQSHMDIGKMKLAQYTYNGRNVWVQAQRIPWIQKRYSSFGRVRAFLQNVIEQIDGVEPMRIGCTWQPDFLITATEDDQDQKGDPWEAGFIDEHGGRHFNDQWTKEKRGYEADTLKSKLR